MGVYQLRSGKWCYEIRGRKEGKQVTLDARYDFDSKDDATLAWIEAKGKVKTRMTHFLFRDCVAGRLGHLDLYSVKDEHEKVSRTYANNRKQLSRFGAWADLPVEEITQEMVKSELKRLLAPSPDGEGLTPAYVNKHLIALKAAFNFAINEKKLLVNPVKGLRFFPEGKKKLKFIPEPGQFAQVLLLAKPMDRAYLTVVAYTAGRISEINKLAWEDVKWDNGNGRCLVCLWTRKKKDQEYKPRWLPVTDKVKQALEYAFKYRTKNSPWVFTNPAMVIKYPDNPTRWRWIYRDKFFKRLCRKVGIPEQMAFHNLRHLASSNMAANGARLTDIQNILGHERATTTDLYLQSLGFNYLEGAADLMDSECCADFCADGESAQTANPYK